MPHLYDVAPLDGYGPEIGLLLAGIQDSTREWRGELGEPPVDAIVWQARTGGHSIGGTLLHLITVELYWFEKFAAGKDWTEDEAQLLLVRETDVDSGIWPTPPAEPIEWYYDLHQRIRGRAFEALRELEPQRVYSRGDYQVTLRWIVAHVLQHDSYHGAQAVLLHDLWQSSEGQVIR